MIKDIAIIILCTCLSALTVAIIATTLTIGERIYIHLDEREDTFDLIKRKILSEKSIEEQLIDELKWEYAGITFHNGIYTAWSKMPWSECEYASIESAVLSSGTSLKEAMYSFYKSYHNGEIPR